MTSERNQLPGRIVVEVPQSVFNDLIEGMKKIDRMERALETTKLISPTDWLTVDEFLARVKVSRWKFELWKDAGILQLKKIGRKIYIHPGEVQRFYNSELELPQ